MFIASRLEFENNMKNECRSLVLEKVPVNVVNLKSASTFPVQAKSAVSHLNTTSAGSGGAPVMVA